jgi:hypothetical protein
LIVVDSKSWLMIFPNSDYDDVLYSLFVEGVEVPVKYLVWKVMFLVMPVGGEVGDSEAG